MRKFGFVVLSLLLALLCCCSPDIPVSPSLTQAGTPSAAPLPTVPPGERETLIFAYPINVAENISSREKSVEDAINRILLARGSSLQLDLLMIDGRTEMPTALASGAYFCDLFYYFLGAEEGYGDWLITDGHVADLSSLVSRVPLYERHPQELWYEHFYEERLWYYPIFAGIFDTGEQAMSVDLNNATLADMEEEPPETLEALISYMSRAKENGRLDRRLFYQPNFPPYAFHRTYPEWPFYVDPESRFLISSQGVVSPYVGSDIFARDTELVSGLLEEDMLELELLPDEDTGAYREYSPELGALWPLSANRNTNEEKTYQLLNPELPTYRLRPSAYGGIFVSSKSERIDACITMIEELYANEELRDLLVYGTPEKDWVLHPEDNTYEGLSRSYVPAHMLMPEPFVREPYQPQRDKSALDMSKWDTRQTVEYISPLFTGFRYWNTLPADSVPSYEDLKPSYKIRTGEMPIEELGDVIATLNAKGYERFIEEVQRQYDSFVGKR